MNLNKDNVKKIILIIAFGIILYWVLQNMNLVKTFFDRIIDILFPFIIGAIIAFIVNIPMKMFENKVFKTKEKSKKKKEKVQENNNVNKPKRIISMIISYVIIILIVTLVIKIIIPQFISIIILFIKDVPDIAYNIKEYAIELTKQYPDISSQIQNIEVNWDDVTKEAISKGTSLVTNLVSSSINVIISIIGGIINTIVAIIFSVYILLSKETLKRQIKKLVIAYLPEKKAEYILNIFSLSKRTFVNFISGQFIEAVILGILCFLGSLILGMPYASTIGVLVGVTSLIPIVGAIIGGIIAGVLILSVSYTKAIIFIIFLILLQQFESNIIYPRVVGSSVGLPGIWVLLAVAVGGSLWGIWGLLIGLPIVSVLYTILGNDINKRIKNKGCKNVI